MVQWVCVSSAPSPHKVKLEYHFLQLLALEKIKTSRRKSRTCSFVSKGWPVTDRSRLAKKKTGYQGWAYRRKSNALTVMIKSLVLAGNVSCCSYHALHMRLIDEEFLRHPYLWQAKDEGVFEPQIFSYKPQTSPTTDTFDGLGINSSQAKHQQATQRA